LPFRHFALLGLTAVLFVAAACSGSDNPEPVATAVPPTTTTVPASPTPLPPTATPVRPEASIFPDALRESSLRYLEQIGELRNTPVKGPVDMFTLSRDQARAYYSSSGGVTSSEPEPAPSATPRRIDVKQEVYELLGLVPEAKPPSGGGQGQPSLQESQIDNLIALITGFYSPELNALYLLETINGGINGSLARSTIVHELTHALQYQYADLDAVAVKRASDWDATTALLSVMEGEAVFTETELLGFSTRSTYRLPVCFTIPAAQRAGTPYVVERELDTWYEDGYCFIDAMAKQIGIDAVFANLPTTTEQILHPEKYLAGEGAKPVTLPDLAGSLGAGWSRAGGGSFGEFTVQNILLRTLPSDRRAVQAAASGWGGDRWSLYVNGESRLLQAVIAWDSAEEASEFWQALRQTLPGVAEGAAYEAAEGNTTWRAKLDGATTTLFLTNDPAVTLTP